MSKAARLWALLLGRPAFYRLNERLYQLALRGIGVLNDRDSKVSGEAHFINNHLSKHVVPDGLFVDVGANEGAYSKLLRHKFPNARIVAFEPHPQTFSRLQCSAAACNVVAVNKAIGAQCGTATLYDHESDGSEQASLHFDTHAISDAKRTVTKHSIEVTTLDCHFAETEEPIALLKIDTEGNELECLKGAQSLIKRGLIDIIQFEFNEMNVASRVYLKDFFDTLPGYTFYRLLPHGMVQIEYNAYHEIFKFQNLVAVRN